jgi:HAMP domain-containing protein
MPDDKSKTGAQDRARINVNQDYELRDWAASLGVTPDELKQAVKAVGTQADDVRRHLGKRQGR